MTALDADLYRVLTGDDCRCDRERIEDPDRLPRIVRFTRPECPTHGTERP